MIGLLHKNRDKMAKCYTSLTFMTCFVVIDLANIVSSISRFHIHVLTNITIRYDEVKCIFTNMSTSNVLVE